MASFKTLDDLVDGGRVLLRVDLNSPVEAGVVRDNHRFTHHARTVRELADRGFQTGILAHQGRPGRDTFVTLEQHADILTEHVDREVGFVPDVAGEQARAAVDALDPGDVLLLENTRMCEEELPNEAPEVKAKSRFVTSLAPAFDAFVNDAYSTAHRSHASIVGFPLVMPAYAGRVMEREYEANSAITQQGFDGPVTMVLGGSKAADVIEVMNALEDTVDNFLLGGIPGELFLRAAGYPVGRDVGETTIYDEQWADNRPTIERLLADNREEICLPVDLAYEDAAGDRAEVAADDISEKTHSYLDVGSETVEAYAPTIRESEAVFLKGALGVFEDDRFAAGTVGVLEAIAETDAFSVVGGGDTSRALEMYGIDPRAFSHVSIAGGAYIRALTGQELVGVEVLERSAAEHCGSPSGTH